MLRQETRLSRNKAEGAAAAAWGRRDLAMGESPMFALGRESQDHGAGLIDRGRFHPRQPNRCHGGMTPPGRLPAGTRALQSFVPSLHPAAPEAANGTQDRTLPISF